MADVAAFHDEHRRRNGYARPDDPVEVVALRATATRPPAVEPAALPAPERLAARPSAARRCAPAARGGGPGRDRRARLHGVGGRGVGRPPGRGRGAGAAPDGTAWTGRRDIAGPGSGDEGDGAEAQRRHGEHRTDEPEHERAGLVAEGPVELALELGEPGVYPCEARVDRLEGRTSRRARSRALDGAEPRRPVRPSCPREPGVEARRRAAGLELDAGRPSWPRRPNRRAGAGP